MWRTTGKVTIDSTEQAYQSTSSMWRTTHTARRNSSIARFQSTSSVWRTTLKRRAAGHRCVISIHVLRVEDDLHN